MVHLVSVTDGKATVRTFRYAYQKSLMKVLRGNTATIAIVEGNVKNPTKLRAFLLFITGDPDRVIWL